MNKGTLYIIGMLLVVVAGFSIYYFSKKDTDPFNKSYKDAIERLDKIEQAIKDANDVIGNTHKKLDDIKHDIDAISEKQKGSNGVVSANEEYLKKKVKEQQAEINRLNREHQETLKDQEFLEEQLDSIKTRIRSTKNTPTAK